MTDGEFAEKIFTNRDHENDYESLPGEYSLSTHMLSGAVAGVGEHTIMYAVDTVKTRMQSLAPSPNAAYRNVPEALFKIVKYEGYARPFRGVSVMVVGAGPAHALYFSCYEKMKRVFSGTATGANNPLAQGAAGCFATVFHDAIMNPAEVVKQRMQVYNSPFKSVSKCFIGIWRNEGMRAFYRSYMTQLTMNIPFQSLHFVTYEFMQELTNKDRRYSPIAHVVSGGLAGAFASAVTNPLDVCKTLLNTQETQVVNNLKEHRVVGMWNACKTIYQCCGFKGFFNGLQARVVYAIPSTAICWLFYESIKHYINKKNNDKLQSLDEINKSARSLCDAGEKII